MMTPIEPVSGAGVGVDLVGGHRDVVAARRPATAPSEATTGLPAWRSLMMAS
jgi:hypothetical protein